MHRILFVCHGNICRSPMAEFVMKDMVTRAGVAGDFCIASAAMRNDEIGSDIHYGTRRVLAAHGIAFEHRAAWRLRPADVANWDMIVCMDEENMRDIARQLGKAGTAKACKLMEFADGADAGRGRDRRPSRVPDVADPWYTGDFEVTYRDVHAGCAGLLAYLMCA